MMVILLDREPKLKSFESFRTMISFFGDKKGEGVPPTNRHDVEKDLNPLGRRLQLWFNIQNRLYVPGYEKPLLVSTYCL